MAETNTAAEVLAQLLVDSGETWTVRATVEPDAPDRCITIYDTVGRSEPRNSPTKRKLTHHGVQVRVRAEDHKVCFQKARELATWLDEIDFDGVTLDGTDYRVTTVSRTTEVLSIGKESGVSKRNLCTINGLAVYNYVPPPFSPADVSNVMRVWYDFADPDALFQDAARTTAAAGIDPLGGVADKSGNARHLGQASAGSRPVLEQAAIGTEQAAYFGVGGVKYLTTGPFGADLPQPSTLFLVVRNTSNAQHWVLDGAATGGRNSVILFGQQWTAYGGGFAGELPLADPGVYILCLEFNGASSKMWRNGASTRGVSTTPLMNFGTQGCGGFTLGSDTTFDDAFPGWVGEVIAYDGVLSDADRNAVTDYLSAKWGRSVYTADTYGTLASGNTWVLLVPPGYDGGPKPLVYFHHGRGASATAVYTDSVGWTTVQALQSAGYWIAACDGATSTGLAATHWGNPASVAANKEFRTFLEGRDTFSRFVLWGISMGGASSLACLRDAQFADVKGWYGTYPVCSQAAIHAANYGGTFAAEVDAAFASVGGYAAYDLLSQSAGGYPAIRYKFVASAGDTVVPKADHTDPMRTLLGTRSPAVVANLLRTHTGDHGDPTAFDGADTVAFYDTCI